MYSCNLCSIEVESLPVRQSNEDSPEFDKGLCHDCLNLVEMLAMASTADRVKEALSWYPVSWKRFQQKLSSFFELRQV